MQGPRVDRVVFWVALPLITGVSVPLVLFPVEGEALLSAAFGWLTRFLGWAYLWFTIAAFALLVYYALGKYGNIRFGGPDARPEFSLLSWVAMIFCAGIGSSVLYWGTIEWVYYYTTPPFGIEPRTVEATEWAATYGLFHWGFTAWAIYCVPTLPLAYLFWNRGQPVLRMSAACEGVIGARSVRGLPGKIIDMFFMFGLLGGVGTSIGLSTPMISAGLSELLDVSRGFWLDAAVVSALGVLFGVSVYTGLQRGIRMLSGVNFWLTVGFLAFVFVCGPTLFIIDTFTNSVGLLFQNFIKMSFYLEPVTKAESMIAAAAGKPGPDSAGTFAEQWTIFYWAWWIAFAPFMGLFVARISRGRTIRELIGAELIGGSLGCWMFFAVLGNTGLFLQMEGSLDLAGLVARNLTPEAIIATVIAVGDRVIPFAAPLLLVFVTLAVIFAATTLDSASYILASVATKAQSEVREPARWHRCFWAAMLSLVSLSLMFVGGTEGLRAVQSASLIVALPLIAVLILMTLSFIRWLKQDHGSGG